MFSGRYKFLYYGGAIRGGKSFVIMAVIFILCRMFPGSRWAIVRKDLPSLKKTVLPIFNALRPPDFCSPMHKTDWIATCTNGSQILLWPESLQEDPTYNRWRGLEVNGIWLEEANELAFPTFTKAIERAGSWIVKATKLNRNPKQPQPYIFLSSNPAGGWVKREFYTPWKQGMLKAPYYFLQATIKDNPYLPKAYLESLEHLPERDYKVFVLGDWDALSGAALEELNAAIHLIPKITIPPHWFRFGAFDWGFRHPFSFGLYAANAEGYTYKVDTITGRRLSDARMIDYVIEAAETQSFPATQLSVVWAGGDAFHDVQARAAVGMTTAERFQLRGIPMIPADPSRIAGLKNLREALAWEKIGPGGTPGTPRFRLFDTPGNRHCFEVLQSMTLDPDRPEDVLKIDADDSGQGGDDPYDETRYALQSRALGEKEPEPEPAEDAHPGFDLKEKKRKPRTRRPPIPGELAEDDPRAGRYGVPDQSFTSFRMPPFGGRQKFGEDEDEF